jgi:Ca2+-binding EF-hand superfamily protein
MRSARSLNHGAAHPAPRLTMRKRPVPNRPCQWLLHCVLLTAVAMLSPPLQAADSTKAVKSDKAGTRRSTQLARADRDGSGTLSRDEVRAGAPRLLDQFDSIDVNHDAELSPQEIRIWSRSHAQQRGRDARTALVTHFTRADADGNGLLSRDEAAARLPRVAAKFDRVDANHDGVVTVDEFDRYLETRRAARPTGR